jgi:hypothetical protein
MFSINDAATLIAYTLLAGIQFIPTNLTYYIKNRKKLSVFRFTVWQYAFIFLIVYPPLILSMYFYSHWTQDATQWQFITVFILYIVICMLDKLWLDVFLKWKNLNATLFLSFFIMGLSILITVLMRFSPLARGGVWWLPFSLMIPFILHYAHTIVLCLDWKANVIIAKFS